MKERPILFNAPMVRALLAGTKTQMRRIFKPDRMTWDANGRYTTHAMRGGELSTTGSGPFKPSSWLHYCPYGQPGDRLWVRESFMPVPLEAAPGPSQTPWSIAYAAGSQTELLAPSSYNPTLYNYARWTPSIHMPRWASRITLEIARVRVERLRACNEVDAIAEGAPWAACGAPQEGSHKAGFAQLWEQINGHGSWEANPWVWVIEFRRLP